MVVIDENIVVLMQSIENIPMTFISKIVSYAFDPIFLCIVSVLIAGFLFYKGKKKQSLFFIGIMMVSAVIISVLKNVFGRIRPDSALMAEISSSFPSGHTTIAVVFFGALAFLSIRELKFKKNFKSNRIIIPTICLILFTGFTRIYLRVHWFTDVIAGFIVGSIILFLGTLIYKRTNLVEKFIRLLKI